MKHVAAILLALAACGGEKSRGTPHLAAATPSPPAPKKSEIAPAASSAAGAEMPAPETPAPSSTPAEPPAPAWPGRTEGCPDGMVRVEGEYCPIVVHTCLEYAQLASSRCLKYQEPSRCAYPKKDHLAYCMDRFEYPNKVGELPTTLVDFHDAKHACEREGKRLCTVDEYNFACEGPEMRPYATGFVRDPTKCNIDRDVTIDMDFRMPRLDTCLKDPRCMALWSRLDRRDKIGNHAGCASWAGIFDLNGNVNEWVRMPEQKNYPKRGGLKGGWWGPIRARCRPTHTTHNEDYWGYELGFRCCKDAEGVPTDITTVSWRPSQSTDR